MYEGVNTNPRYVWSLEQEVNRRGVRRWALYLSLGFNLTFVTAIVVLLVG